MDSTANMHVCNNKYLMANYVKRSKQIGKSTSERISLGWRKIQLRRAVSRDSERKEVTLTFNNVYYLLNSLSNLVSLVFLNDNKIYLYHENEILYGRDNKEILASTQQLKKSFLLKPLNLSDAKVYLTQTDKKIHKSLHVYQIVSTLSLPLTTWHK